MNSIILQNLTNDFILDRLKEIKKSQNNIKINELDYTAKSEKCQNFSNILLPFVFLRNTHTLILSIENVDEGKSDLFKKLNDVYKDGRPIGFILDSKEKFLNSFILIDLFLYSFQ